MTHHKRIWNDTGESIKSCLTSYNDIPDSSWYSSPSFPSFHPEWSFPGFKVPLPQSWLNYSRCHNIHEGCGEKWDERFPWCSDDVSLLLLLLLLSLPFLLVTFSFSFTQNFLSGLNEQKQWKNMAGYLFLPFNPFALLLIVSLLLHLFLMLGEEEEREWRTK